MDLAQSRFALHTRANPYISARVCAYASASGGLGRLLIVRMHQCLMIGLSPSGRLLIEATAAIRNGVALDAERIKSKICPIKDAATQSRFSWNGWKEQVEILNIAPGTRRQYKSLLIRLTEFDRLRRWDDLTAENIVTLTLGCTSGRKKDGEELLDSAVFKYHRNLKALLNRAVTFGKIRGIPYEAARGKFKRGDRENLDYLTEDEMKTIEEMECPMTR